MRNKLILGTVQFGLNYGINNLTGQPTQQEVFAILDEASHQGIQYLDTADAYGNAINVIGNYHLRGNNTFKILSKFNFAERGELAQNAKKSLEKLHISAFEVYSYHSFASYYERPYLIDELLLLKQLGLIKKIGISIYTNDELQHAINDNFIDVIQLPFNLLDNQNVRGICMNLAKQKEKEIHVRSVYLQGLFFMNPDILPHKLSSLKPYLKSIHAYCEKESISIGTLALSYALYNQCVDQVLVGVDSKEQLIKNLNASKEIPCAFDFINQEIQVKETELLNPVNWK
jgi:aryl-alcohol dehydrogenase-like predicted oxidoreductase